MTSNCEEQELLKKWENEFSNRFTSEDESFMKVKNAVAINPPAIPDWNIRSDKSDRWRGGRGSGGYRNGGRDHWGGRGGGGGWGRRPDRRDKRRFHEEGRGERSYHQSDQHHARNRWNDRGGASASSTTNCHLNDNGYNDTRNQLEEPDRNQ